MVLIQAAKLSKISNLSKNLDMKLPASNKTVAAIKSMVVDNDLETVFNLAASTSESTVTSDNTIAVITT